MRKCLRSDRAIVDFATGRATSPEPAVVSDKSRAADWICAAHRSVWGAGAALTAVDRGGARG
jgi:hypothetical protein